MSDEALKRQYIGNFQRFVGYSESNRCISQYFSNETIETIYYKLIELLMGVDPGGRPIVVPHKTIVNVMSQVYDAYRPPTMDIYARYNISSDLPESYVQAMIDQTIAIIVSDVRNSIGMEENNSKLTAWTTVLGDFNQEGLRSHAPIKIREKNTSHRGVVSFSNY
jgi:hypothetical protein